jgi:hypothetical protein
MDIFQKAERAYLRHKSIILTRRNRAERRRKKEKHKCCNDQAKLIIGNSLKTKDICCPITRCALNNRLWNKRYINKTIADICLDCY